LLCQIADDIKHQAQCSELREMIRGIFHGKLEALFGAAMEMVFN